MCGHYCLHVGANVCCDDDDDDNDDDHDEDEADDDDDDGGADGRNVVSKDSSDAWYPVECFTSHLALTIACFWPQHEEDNDARPHELP